MHRAPSTRQCRVRFAIALAAMVAAAAVVLAQAPAVVNHHNGVTEAVAGQATPSMIERHQMMQRMSAADQKLSELIAAMNAATGDKKVEAIAAVVTELAAQRRQMQEQMRMQRDMMEQMMSRMAAMPGNSGMMKKAPEK